MENKNFYLNLFFLCLHFKTKHMVKDILTIGEQIDRNREGRTQKWIVAKMVVLGCPITEVQFSNKKNGNDFTEEELAILSQILGTELSQPK